MPWSSNNGGPQGSGPWGGGGRGSGGGGRGQGPRNPWGGGNRPNGGGGGGGGGSGGGGGQGPNIDDFFRRGQDQLKNVLGQGGGGGGVGILLLLLLLAGAWVYGSVYIVREGERAVVLTFGEYTRIATPGPTFAPWPVQTAEIENVENQRVITLGASQALSGSGSTSRLRGATRDEGLMLTGDENIVDIEFSVVWNVSDLQEFLFNLARPDDTIRAVAEAAIREVVGQSELLPLLNVGRGQLGQDVRDRIQSTLDDYQAGVRVIRVNLADIRPPETVLEAFRDVQAAEQERNTRQNEAQAYFNQRTAEARGEAAAILENAEAYRARVVAEAEGEAARFVSILTEYQNATEVTRRRLYLETMERVLGGMNKIILSEQTGGGSGEGVIQYLPLDQLNRERRGGTGGTGGTGGGAGGGVGGGLLGGGQSSLLGGQGGAGGATNQ